MSDADMRPVLELRDITRSFRQGENALHILRGASLKIMPGEIVALIGPSGAGKSTLLHIAGLLERPDAGLVLLGGIDCVGLPDRDRTALRRSELGFVYQAHNLLPEFNALENVAMPELIAGEDKRAAQAEATRLLSLLGLGERLLHRPTELSGGEQQRVAIARALANRPRMLLADEPTGNLDPKTSKLVFDELIGLVKHEGLSALIATHNLDLAAKMDRALVLHEGQLVEGKPN
jgi:lipoprotein-releasing system ATP-binding protein